MDTMLRISWTDSTAAPCLKIALDIGLYQGLGGELDRSWTVEELCKATGAATSLLKRLLRFLASMDVVREVTENIYAPTKLLIAMQDRSVNSAIDFRLMLQDGFAKLPAFFKRNGYQSPENVSKGPWQFATEQDCTFFDWLLETPERLEIMSSHMSGYTQGRETWEAVYPIEQRIIEGIKRQDDLLLVDVGGGAGHDLQRLSHNLGFQHEQVPRLILQDLPAVLDHAKSLPSSIRAVSLDFFEDSPIVGARAYCLHSVLHDWPDREAIIILRTMQPALRRREDGYKPKLLLNETVLPRMGLDELTAAKDWFMLMVCASYERTVEQWENILTTAGFKLTGVFSNAHVDEAIIEAELNKD